MFLHLAALAIAPQAVSFQADAIRVDRLIKELSAQSGTTLATSPEVAAEPIVVQIEKRDLDEVLDRVAKVVGAEWRTEGGARRLIRPPTMKSREEREDADRFAETLGRLLGEFEKTSQALPKFDEAQARRLIQRYVPVGAGGEELTREFQHLQNTNPINHAAHRLMASIDPDQLAKMYIGQRIVFSDSPTLAQVAIPAKAKEAFESLKSDAKLMERALAAPKPEGRYVNFGGLPTVGPGTFESGYGKSLVSLQRRGFLSFSYRVQLLDAAGQSLVSASGEIPSRSRQRAALLTHEGKPLEISELVKNFAYLRQDVGYAAGGAPSLKDDDGSPVHISFGVGMAEANGKPPDLGLGTLLHDPVERDPLGIVFGSLIRQVAAKEGKPLIASISDGAIVSLMEHLSYGLLSTDGDLRQFLEQSRAAPDVRVPHADYVEDKEWLLIRPAFPSVARVGRFNREALKTFLSAIRSKGVVAMADAATYIEKTSLLPRTGSLDMMYISHADAGISRQASEWMMSPALPLFASLGPEQWQRFREGGNYADLSLAQRETLRRWVFDDLHFVNPTHMMRLAGQAGAAPSPLTLEPTQLWPAGIPAGSQIHLERKDSPAVMATAKSGYRFIFNMESLAYQDLQGAEGEFLGARWNRHFELYLPAVQSSLKVTFRLSPEHVIEHSAYETRPLAGALPVPKAQLPEAHLKRYEWAKKALSGGDG